MPRRCLILSIALACLFVVAASPAAAQAPAATPIPLRITSPVAGSTVGGLVAIFGASAVRDVQSYSLAFAPSRDAVRWIPIGEPYTGPVAQGRLGLWDTTVIPDGVYVLRLRATRAGVPGLWQYLDYYTEGVLVSNSPRTPTPRPTPNPSATPTPTVPPTLTPTAQPTPALEDGVSPYLYVTMLDQYDPLCVGWQQSLGVWVSNVGPITVTNVVLTATLPEGSRPVLDTSSPGGATDGAERVAWVLGGLGPGDARKLELQMEVPAWSLTGVWLTVRVDVSSDQVPHVARSESFLLDDCSWLEATAAALPLPTFAPSRTPKSTSATARQTLPNPTVRPTLTPISMAAATEVVGRSLDIMTILIGAALLAMTIAMAVLLYQRLARRSGRS